MCFWYKSEELCEFRAQCFGKLRRFRCFKSLIMWERAAMTWIQRAETWLLIILMNRGIWLMMLKWWWQIDPTSDSYFDRVVLCRGWAGDVMQILGNSCSLGEWNIFKLTCWHGRHQNRPIFFFFTTIQNNCLLTSCNTWYLSNSRSMTDGFSLQFQLHNFFKFNPSLTHTLFIIIIQLCSYQT